MSKFIMPARPLKFILSALLFSITAIGQTESSKLKLNKEKITINISKAQSWWNVIHYTINITPDYIRKSISGVNTIQFYAIKNDNVIEIDLQEPMKIIKVTWNKKNILFKKIATNTYLITFQRTIKAGEIHSFSIHFEGKPRESLNPPYDSGWIWSKDQKGRPWISVACQGSGASIWLPCKDVLYDKPDNGALINITVPDTLSAVANGRLLSKTTSNKGYCIYSWQVVNPINNYNIIPYIGKYVSWHKNYRGLKGNLDCDYWVLDYNLDKAKTHFTQADTMLKAFEYWLGPYPFYEDSYKLVEAPMPGMEHQSAVAYGNGFQNGFLGKDFISGTTWSLKWDFMIIHESGHEWFGNSITSNDHADTWIHEGFTKYLETLYTSYVFGRDAGNEYALGTWKRIKNDLPILGNNTSDKYYKASAMLHTIRQILNDTIFKDWLTALNQAFLHETATTKQILHFLNQYTNKDFSKVFAQYLETIQIPELEYYFKQDKFYYRWVNCIEKFIMPLSVSLNGESNKLIYPTTDWQHLIISVVSQSNLTADKNFYVKTKEISPPREH